MGSLIMLPALHQFGPREVGTDWFDEGEYHSVDEHQAGNDKSKYRIILRPNVRKCAHKGGSSSAARRTVEN